MDLASQRIRDKLRYGVLPDVDPVSTWAGYGSGRICDGCELIIGPKEAEHETELANGRTLRFHARCATLWKLLRPAVHSS